MRTFFAKNYSITQVSVSAAGWIAAGVYFQNAGITLAGIAINAMIGGIIYLSPKN